MCKYQYINITQYHKTNPLKRDVEGFSRFNVNSRRVSHGEFQIISRKS